jgi:hypothetical protein
MYQLRIKHTNTLFNRYGVSLRTIQTRWMPAVFLAINAVHMLAHLKKAKLVRMMLRVQVRMAVSIQRFVRKVLKVCMHQKT